jgi:hypothetical protein
MDELETRIVNAFREIEDTPDLIKRCHLSVRRRANQYMEKNGGHFEYAN